jgi:5-methylcytosine-specific restriction endonuclease McrA
MAVLVLNATFEPLSVVSGRRAVVLVLAERAEHLHGTGRVLRSERLVIEEPSVVRLTRFVQVPYDRPQALSRRAVFVRDEHRCQYCGARADSIDHVVPRSRGGTHTWENVVAACRRCNTRKRDRLLHETPFILRKAPRPPHRSAWFAALAGSIPDTWAPYLEPAPRSA